VVREEVAHRQLPPTPQTLGQVMIELREQFGPAIIAQRIIAKFPSISEPYVIIDGARSEAEVKAFQEVVDQVLVIAVHAAPPIRFERLRQRGRDDDALNQTIFHERDERELDIGLGRVIAQADIMIVNEGEYEDLQSKIHQVLTREFNLN
jgi:dephospho-CoA kinase